MAGTLGDWIVMFRPKHWAKNAFVLAPALFSERIFETRILLIAVEAFAVFCCVSSAIYVINDMMDRHSDALHPRKCHRPLAAGRIRLRAAGITAVLLLAISLMTAYLAVGPRLCLFVLAYIVNTMLYIFLLKHRVIVDVMMIAIGFVIRLIAGSVAVEVEPSSWLYICGFALAMMLGFGKRRVEVAQSNVDHEYRSTLISYTPEKVNLLLAVSTAICLLAYMLYTVAPETIDKHGTKRLVLSVPIVAYGLFRYLFKAVEAKADGPTEILFNDPVFFLIGGVWGTSILLILATK